MLNVMSDAAINTTKVPYVGMSIYCTCFDVYVTVDHCNNNINSQLDATIMILLMITISSTYSGDNFARNMLS